MILETVYYRATICFIIQKISDILDGNLRQKPVVMESWKIIFLVCGSSTATVSDSAWVDVLRYQIYIRNIRVTQNKKKRICRYMRILNTRSGYFITIFFFSHNDEDKNFILEKQHNCAYKKRTWLKPWISVMIIKSMSFIYDMHLFFLHFRLPTNVSSVTLHWIYQIIHGEIRNSVANYTLLKTDCKERERDLFHMHPYNPTYQRIRRGE